MVPASRLRAFLLAALVAALPAAAAQQGFYLRPDMSLDLAPAGEFEVPITAIIGEDTSYWSRTMQSPGSLLPVAGTIHVRIKGGPHLGPAASAEAMCPLTIYVGIADGRFVYWCKWIDELGTGVTTDGDYAVAFELRNPDIEPIAFLAGDTLFVWLASTGSQAANPSAFAIAGEGGSFVRVSGTREVAPTPTTTPPATTSMAAQPGAPTSPAASTSPAPATSAPSTSPTSAAAASATAPSAAPEPGTTWPVGQDSRASASPGVGPWALTLGLVVAGLLVRRRLVA